MASACRCFRRRGGIGGTTLCGPPLAAPCSCVRRLFVQGTGLHAEFKVSGDVLAGTEITGRVGVGWGDLTLHCNRHSDFCIKMYSNGSHFHESLIVRGKGAKQCL